MDTYLKTYVWDGGILMIPLLFCVLLLVGATIQSMIRLRRARVMPDFLRDHAASAANKNDRIAFARDLEGQSSPLARALALTLKELDLMAGHHPHRRPLEERVEEAVAYVADDMYEDLAVYATLYTVGPLLGLLGTILGMVNAFQVFYQASQKDLSQLSAGVEEALITTLWGLAIAIPAFVIAQSFQSKVRRYERNELPRKAIEIVGLLWASHPPAPEPAAEIGAPE